MKFEVDDYIYNTEFHMSGRIVRIGNITYGGDFIVVEFPNDEVQHYFYTDDRRIRHIGSSNKRISL